MSYAHPARTRQRVSIAENSLKPLRTHHWLRSCGIILGILYSFVWPALAQSDTARLTGVVTDTSGGVIAGATVTATETATNAKLETTTNADGVYVFPVLKAGTYLIEFSAPNFKKLSRPEVVLRVNQVLSLNAELEPGNITDVVEVTAGAPLVETASSSVGQTITGRQIIDLPINGRNFTQLATLTPGVTRGTPGSNADGSGGNAETFRQGDTGSAALSVNGLREQNNNFTLDGIDNNESIVNTIVFFPPIEAIEEFRVITSVAPAEFGRGGGAIVSATIRSGSNDFHGSAFEFFRNSAMDARATDLVGVVPPKPVFIRHQFGGTFGGPIVRGKTFFFADYQQLRQRLPREEGRTFTVPTARMRQGDFSELLNPNFTGLGAAVQIFDPLTGLPFPGNIIPQNRLDPAAVRYLNFFPLPDLPDRARFNFFNRQIQRQNFKGGDLRLDHRFTERDTVFVRFSIADDPQFDPGRLGINAQTGFGSGTNRQFNHSVMGNYTRTFTPSVVNELRFGYVKQNIEFLPLGFGTDLNRQLGIPGINGITRANGISLIGGGNGDFLEYLGDFGEFILNQRTIQFTDAVTWVTGNHSAKFGASIIQRNIRSVQADFSKGFYFFSDQVVTFRPGGPPPASPGLGQTGYQVAQMLVGRTAFTTTANPEIPAATTRSYEMGFFAQDDWRINRRLTLNAGLRYELFTPYYELNNRMANFDPASGRILLAGRDGNSRSLVDTDRNNFAPRIGAAFDLTGKGRTVLRGGWGIFYSLDRGGIANQLTQNPPFIVTQFRFDGPGSNVRLSDPIPPPDPINLASPNLPPGTQIRYTPRNTQNTRVQQFNVAFEHQLTDFLAFHIAYVGTRGANVTAVTTVGGFGDAEITRRLTTIANVGESRYDSLQIKVNQRAWKGLSYLAAYTFGKATNNSPGPFPGTGGAGRSTPADPGGLAPGLADYDVRHRFTFGFNYDLPFFKEASNRAVRALLYGYQLNGIVTLQGGTPFSVFGGDGGRARLVPGQNPNAGRRSAARWFNTAAFAPSANPSEQYPRNAFLRSPGISTVDASIFRRFTLTERLNLEFRAEAFNLFNKPQLGFPNIFLGGDFGRIFSVRNRSNRSVQLGLRLSF